MKVDFGAFKTFVFLYDGHDPALFYLRNIRGTYKEWPHILNWLVENDYKGKKLVEFFQNESPDGKGVFLGVAKILSRLKGSKYYTKNVYGVDLL